MLRASAIGSPALRTARRRASSAAKGILTVNVSDHMPFRFKSKSKKPTVVTSWNMLADEHLYNNFRNIVHLQTLLGKLPHGNVYNREKKIHHFLSELAQYLFRHQVDNNKVIITTESLQDFVSHLDEQGQKSALESNYDPSELLNARKEIIGILINESNNNNDRKAFRDLLSDCMKLIYHIQHEDGALRWKHRYKILQKNTKLREELLESDILCLQECTEPNDILNLFKDGKKTMQMITYKVDGSKDDHCVLMFDKKKFTIVNEAKDIIKYPLNGNKPCIFVRLKNIDKNSPDFGKEFIFASIHYPMGNHHRTSNLKEQVDKLCRGNKLPTYLVGDFNHEKKFFENELATLECDLEILAPSDGTMGGADGGNTNKAIDAVMTNNASNVDIQLLENLEISTQGVHHFEYILDKDLEEQEFRRPMSPSA